jgi:ribosomal protein S12 methylthiotransferase
VSLGCPKNLVDSEVMMGILTRAGYEITPRFRLRRLPHLSLN